MSCSCEHAPRRRRVARDGAGEIAAAADAHAYDLALEVDLHPPATMLEYAGRAMEAADAWEVAADAWEEAGRSDRAELSRHRAAHYQAEAFAARHARLWDGFYVVTDREAKAIAAASREALPREGYSVPVLLGRHGPEVELHRFTLTGTERRELNHPRSWTYAINAKQRGPRR